MNVGSRLVCSRGCFLVVSDRVSRRNPAGSLLKHSRQCRCTHAGKRVSCCPTSFLFPLHSHSPLPFHQNGLVIKTKPGTELSFRPFPRPKSPKVRSTCSLQNAKGWKRGRGARASHIHPPSRSVVTRSGRWLGGPCPPADGLQDAICLCSALGRNAGKYTQIGQDIASKWSDSGMRRYWQMAHFRTQCGLITAVDARTADHLGNLTDIRMLPKTGRTS